MEKSSNLREILLEELTSLRSGKTDAPRAKAVAALANTVLKSVEVEMAYREQVSKIKTLPALGEMPLLGNEPQSTPSAPGNILKNTIEAERKPDESTPRLPDIPKHLVANPTRTVRGRAY